MRKIKITCIEQKLKVKGMDFLCVGEVRMGEYRLYKFRKKRKITEGCRNLVQSFWRS